MITVLDSKKDTGLPTLAAVLDPAELARHLGGVLQWDTSAELRIKVLRYKKADRCTLEIAMKPLDVALASSSGAPASEGAWHELIGKVFAEDRTDILRTMEDLQRAGFDSNAEFGVPRPVAFLPTLRLLIYDKAPGARARKVIAASNGSGSPQVAERCAQWLAHFHACGPRSEPVFTLHHHLELLEQARRSVAKSDASLSGKADQLFARLVAAAQRLGDHELRASHGTYTPGQILLADGHTTTIDWDTYQVADPAFDVARFLVELKRMGLKYTGSSDGYQSVAAVFLSTYRAIGNPSVTQRLAFQQGAIFLDRAKHDLEKEARDKAETMLDEGLRVIGEDG